MKKLKVLYVLLVLSTFICNAQERIITTSDGVNLFVKIKGEGNPCLYIHGGPGAGSYSMEKFFGKYLENSFRVIYLDQRGSGRSSSPTDGNYSLNRIIKDFNEVREALGIHEWFTLGHSFGGFLQMAYFEMYPESVKGMLMINCTLSLKSSLVNSWIPKARELAGIEKSGLISESKDSIIEELTNLSKAMGIDGVGWKMSFLSKSNYDIMDLSYEDISDFNFDFSSLALTVDDFWHDYRNVTSEIDVPVLFFYGTSDWCIGENHYKDIKFPNMILWKSDVGHFPFIEKQEDLISAIDFFTNEFQR